MRSGRAPLLAAMRSASSRVLIWGTSGQFRWIQAKTASQVTGSFGAASNVQFTIQSGPTSSRTSAIVNISARRCEFSCTRETSECALLPDRKGRTKHRPGIQVLLWRKGSSGVRHDSGTVVIINLFQLGTVSIDRGPKAGSGPDQLQFLQTDFID